MECIEARALKSSFLSEKSTHNQQGTFLDEFWCVAGINNVVNSDDFSVDDLLDFSDKDFSEDDEEKDSISVSSRDNDVNSNSGDGGDGIFGPLPAGELIVPVDEMENLEWLSKIVDDSVANMSLLYPADTFKKKIERTIINRFIPVPNRFIPVPRPPVQKHTLLGFSYPVPKKPRTQRFRPSRPVWTIGSLSLVDSLSASSSSYDSSTTSSILFTNSVQSDSIWAFGKPPAKKQKRNRPMESTGSMMSGRYCSHCLVQKTPQWRTGSLGSKTLCNACGVRFKSGRLYPEYRPACSPTFSGEAHSNSHRKVLEMRRMKEMSKMDSMSEPGLA